MRHIRFVYTNKPLLVILITLCFTTSHVAAQKKEEGDKKKEQGKKDEPASKLPDDSILIAVNKVDSVPAGMAAEDIAKKLTVFLSKQGFHANNLDEGDAKVIYTTKREMSKEIKFTDRKLELIYVFSNDGKSGLKVKLYATEKINSYKKNWQILGAKTKNKVLYYDLAFRQKVNMAFK